MKQNIYDRKSFSKEYDKLRFENQNNANNLIEHPTIISLLPDIKDKSILDLGCGYGEMDKYYKEHGAKSVFAIDISSHMIDIANECNKIEGVEFKVMAIEDILAKLRNQKFDIVVSSLAFHYVKDFDKLLKDIKELLVLNGYLVFSQAHPIRTCFKSSESLEDSTTIINGKFYGYFSDYNREGPRVRKWMGEDVERYHRNFSTIINTLISNNFIIEKILEPVPTKEIIEKNPKFVQQWDRPYFLFVKAHIN